ncbi:unnamed protein product [Clavelina lepadiformis]|uniref:Profilin n=1 Tax=Clavelina lepadiformis TaxID=159417 RepID=A0ABP0GNT6_CLALP
MNWYHFCNDALIYGAPFVEYAYLGSERHFWGEKDKYKNFRRFTNHEVSVIVNSYASNFILRGEEFGFLKTEGDIFVYESSTRSLACGKFNGGCLIVISCMFSGRPMAAEHCKRSVEYGLRCLNTSTS